MRKEHDYHVMDRLILEISGDALITDVVCDYAAMITQETLSTFAPVVSPDIDRTILIEEREVIIKIARQAL